MPIDPQDYAFLSNDVYTRSVKGAIITAPSGLSYRVREVYGDQHGYFGAIYENLSTSELVVSHRGTQFGDDWQDLVSDAQMATNYINQQIFGAMHIMELAEELASRAGGAVISVTGHSLGGSLAQVTAYRFGLHGETFNAYGAAGQYETPEGGSEVVNYMRATDLVAAAGTHYGENRIYATVQDINLLFNDPLFPPGSLWNVIQLHPGVTHSPEQFYGSNSIITNGNADIYKNEKFLYDVYRAQIWAAAHGIGAVVPVAAMVPGVPGQAGFKALMNYLYGSYADAITHAALLGTAGDDIRSGTAAADYLGGAAGADTLSSAGGEDVLRGGSGTDTLRGQGDDDYLDGGSDDDYLDGGSGSDELEGGIGNDQYDFSIADFHADPGSSDMLFDSDGTGTLTIDGVQMTVGERLGANSWRSLDGNFKLSVAQMTVGLMLIIEHEETGSTILVKDWNDGMFGMYLGGEVEEPVTNRGEIFGAGNDSGDVHEIQGATWVDRADESHKLVGNAGNDGLSGGYANDVLEGGDNNDAISGGGGEDRISGGAGNDYITNFDGYFTWATSIQVLRNGVYTTIPIEQYISELAAENSSIYSYGKSWFLTAPDASSGDVTQFYQSVEMVTYASTYDTAPGSHADGADVIDGGQGSDLVFGGKGADIINGGDDNDVLTGGRDGDYISGDAGNDVIFGDRIFGNLDENWHYGITEVTGNDLLFGGVGDDQIYGQGGNDTLFGQDGSDTLRGDRYDELPGSPNVVNEAAGDDYIDGGAGVDFILGNAGNDTLLGGSGNDEIEGDDIATAPSDHGDDNIDAGENDDTVWGGGGNDVIRGGSGNDTLLGDYNVAQLGLQYHGNDLIFGDAGNDILIGDGGDDYLDGGSDDDQLHGKEGNDRLAGGSGADQLVGGIGSDTLDGGEDDDKLWGEEGDDTLQGGIGNDELQGGDGKDMLIGGEGHDKLWGDAGDDVLEGGDGYDEIVGGAGNDVMSGGGLSDVLNGNEGEDLLRGDDGDDNLSGNADNDTLYGGSGSDYLGGDEGNDLLYGDAGSDTLVGGDGNDTLRGGADGDILNGGIGEDMLEGGAGNDQLSGGLGNDTYYFNTGFGTDYLSGLADEDSGNDTIVIGGGIAASDTYWVYDGNDLVIHAGRQEQGIFTTWRDRVTLQGFVLSNGRHNIVFEDGSVRVHGAETDDTIVGGAGSDDLQGFGGNDIIQAGPGNDRIEGGEGADAAYGGLGDDSYYSVETVNEAAGEGIDTVYLRGITPNTYTLSANVENLDVQSSYTTQFHTLNGNGLDNTITLRNGSNFLTYPALLNGGAGADKYVYISDTSNRYVTIYIDNINDTWEGYVYASFGTELLAGTRQFDVRSYLDNDFVFDTSIREFRTYGTQAISITGDDANNVIWADSNAAANLLTGGLGDDRYYVDASDIVVENGDGGNDRIILSSGTATTYTMADNVEWLESYVSGELHGNALNNSMTFMSATGSLHGEGGDDNLSISGGQGALYGGQGNDTLTGGNAGDVLDGGTGDDVMGGGKGDDTYYVDSAGDVIYEYDNPAVTYDNDKVFSSAASYTLGNEVENLELLAGAVAGYGNSAQNTIKGNGGDNFLAGNGGYDFLYGGSGSDTYLYNLGDGPDVLIDDENVAGQIDVLRLGAGITTADVKVKKTLYDGIYAEIGGFRISFSDGELYWHEYDMEAASRIERIEFADGTIWNVDDVANRQPTSIQIAAQEAATGELFSMVLPENMFVNDPGESLTITMDLPDWMSYDPIARTLSGTPPTGTGFLHAVVITATDPLGQAAVLEFAVRVFNRIDGTAAADMLTGTDYSDIVRGLGGNDTLNGGYGFDRLLGGLGDDTYVIAEDDDADEIVELAGEGIDLVKIAWDYTLGDNVEKLTLTGSQSVGGVGNALDNTLTGNSAANELVGLEGNDILDGKSGSDTMIGGLGDDTYFVERTGDIIVETAGEGIDSVSSSISYTLQNGLENLTLTGSSTLSATGNAADNVLTGNSGANTITGHGGNDTLDGKSGADTLIGGIGDDTYVVDNANDSVQEVADEGIDNVQSSIAHTLANNVENLTITGTGTLAGTGNTLDNVLVGGSGANALSGLAGNDTLEGKAGTDTLTGGAGNDTYVMARTYGTDTVVENDATAGVVDVARFLSGVTYDQLWFKRPSSSNNLEISIIGTTDKLVIKDWYLGTQYRVEEIRTVDGNKVLQAANVQALVTAMAGMTQPPQGQTTLTPAQQTTLAPVFASTWQNQTLLSRGSASITTGGNQQSVATEQGGIALPPEGSQASAPNAITPRVPLHGGSNIAAPPAAVGNGQTGQPALLAEAYALELQQRQRERYLAKYGVTGSDSGAEIESLIAAMASFAPGMSMSDALPAENAANRHAMSITSPL